VFDYSSVRILDKTKFAILFIAILLVFMVSLPYYGLGYFQAELNEPFEQICPARPFFVYFQQIIGWEPWSTGVPTLGIFALGFFFVAAFVFRKFWCRICPVGAVNSPFNKYSLLTLQKDGELCTKCRICLRACPMDIEEIYEEKGKTNISSKECIHCYRCVELCPEEDCLSVAFLEKKLLHSKSPYKKLSLKFTTPKKDSGSNINPNVKQKLDRPGGPGL
jgi:polyferredoxin